MSIFNEQYNEQYRVAAVASDRLLVWGILSGEVQTILNPEPRLASLQKSIRLES